MSDEVQLRPLAEIIEEAAEAKKQAEEEERKSLDSLKDQALSDVRGALRQKGIDPDSVEIRTTGLSKHGVQVMVGLPGHYKKGGTPSVTVKFESDGRRRWYTQDVANMIRRLKDPTDWVKLEPLPTPKPKPEPEPDTPRCPFTLFREECGDTCPIYNHQVGMCSVAVLALKIGQDVVREERA